MTSASKAKGSNHERMTVDYLIEQGWPYAERRIAGDFKDRGDIAGVPRIVFECKNEKRIDLAGYMKELETEVANDRADLGVAVVKKKGTTNVGDYYAVMPMHMLIKLLKSAGY
jgi:hypothetical protein